jgi:hypothetical protein
MAYIPTYLLYTTLSINVSLCSLHHGLPTPEILFLTILPQAFTPNLSPMGRPMAHKDFHPKANENARHLITVTAPDW